MQFGVGLPNYSRGASVQGVHEVAQAAEELGYDSVWTTDHLLVPKEHAEVFGYVLEAVLTLGYVAALTRRVRLGTSIIVLAQRSAIQFAKEMATLDQYSNGRVIVGVGAGWMEGEFNYLKADFHRRGRVLDESIGVLRAIWEQDEPAFRGRFYHFDGAVSYPKPVQAHVPVWVGGNSDGALRRAARNDGWHSNAHNPEVLGPKYAEVKRLSNGHATLSTRFSMDLDPNKAPLVTTASGETRRRLTGTPDTVRETLRAYEQAGLEYPVLFFPQTDLTVMLKQMETFAKDVMASFR